MPRQAGLLKTMRDDYFDRSTYQRNRGLLMRVRPRLLTLLLAAGLAMLLTADLRAQRRKKKAPKLPPINLTGEVVQGLKRGVLAVKDATGKNYYVQVNREAS